MADNAVENAGNARPQIKLRTAFRQRLQAYTDDILTMSELARDHMVGAAHALISQDLEAAEEALTGIDQLCEIHARCEDRAMALLARQSPVATDLRQVVAYLHIESDLTRMGNLARLVATIARQHHPAPALPAEVGPALVDVAEATKEMAEVAVQLIESPDVEAALLLRKADARVDAMTRELTARASSADWEHSNREAVDCALVARYFERYADHCVRIGERVIFMVTGARVDEYATHRDLDDEEQAERIAELQRRFTPRG